VAVLNLPDGLRTGYSLSLDVLDVANRAARGLQRPPPFHPIELAPGKRLPRNLAAIVLPGMGCATAGEVDRTLAADHGRWAVKTLRAARKAGVYVATSCAGVFVAAAAGVLEGGSATTSWFLEAELAARHPDVDVKAECVLVESGSVLTGGAAFAHADVMLALVDRMAGAAIADLCASYLLLDRRQSQRPYMVLSALIQGDAQLVRAEAWVRERIADPFSVGEVASAVGLGTRTFARRLQKTCGLSPIQFVQRVRMDVARALIEQGASVEAAAAEVGYSDASTLRRLLRRNGHR